jgi:23S rRNA (cytidine2498-2'-O)-methyltransferase
MFDQLVLLCRPGFEKECAGEIMQQANTAAFPAYAQADDNSGIVHLVSSSKQSTLCLLDNIEFRKLIFIRQWFVANKEVTTLSEDNRVPDILSVIKTFDETFADVEIDYADTNEGKSISKFCKQFKPHLVRALKKNDCLSAHAKWRLHLLFSDSQHAVIGISPIDNSASDAMGIKRLRMPGDAPSRSTLKMEEAIYWFLSGQQQNTLISNGMRVVDLGAAPGGWSWQFVRRDCLVTAIDNGPMNAALMATGMVEHIQTDAFTYTPDKPVDWLICDMAERPLHVSRLIARWFTNGYCKNAIFNLKLPMKKRLLAVQECTALLEDKLSQAAIDFHLQAKQLYHDREEITVCIVCS